MFRVKGVPLIYLPIFYYPIQEDDRATGFLMPTYGTSTLRGQSLSNAFLLGDQPQPGRDDRARLVLEGRAAVGGEYRYILGAGLDGHASNARCSTKRIHADD